MSKQHTFRIPVKRPRGWPYNFENTKVGDLVMLVPEPDNVQDDNAIMIMDLEKKVMGYVPRELAAMITPAMKRGQLTILGAKVHDTEVSPDTGWVRLLIEVTIETQQTQTV